MFSLYHSQLFHPNILSIFINPFYFSRRGLHIVFRKICPKVEGDVLDFGCGSKPYQKLFLSAKTYIGVDFVNEGHSHETEDIDFFYDGEKLPFEDQKFDTIFASEVFEHIENLDHIIVELKRVLKPNGQILVSVPFVYMEHEMPYDFRRFSQNGLESFLKQNGFEILDSHKTTKDFETVFQIIAINLYALYISLNKYLKLVLNIIFIFPLTVLGILISSILPNRGRFYCNTVVLAKKI